MKQYEILYIIPTQYTDTEIEKITADISALVEGEGGKVTRNENLGRIKLAYPIKKIRHGSYILVHFEGEPSMANELDRKLRLSEQVLRHQILLMPKGAETRKYEITSYVAPLAEKIAPETPRTKEKEKKIAPPPPIIPEENPMSMEELDKKLDEILESEVK
ncbi:MAG: 30S ribosomal protein S6 [Candidatus Uhrbacteria bacterium GW2011_GWE2_40_58]|nr:MAG: 30S ribosomal protein S6 [Candidatus Uhrbacteria bacterium GW2011_GWF2_40_263]KKR67097.1 MAG: 30S ribosomal protein S6 [Candidatus Uhrbacteria bacterium GW2011_GWE2_40_58]OGL97479.1 MAG: 30S ribosomal protein S6 [Candidatus Uhrbacteria bacterium RIFOXYB2_FULL_41_18]HBK35215.1 30S ribosomal protein S6 [Candidatus Uhrbacteria bacterium]HCB55360.1 30S ribosomal protein S6 [Candidatus Uhrbacteria bacterium]